MKSVKQLLFSFVIKPILRGMIEFIAFEILCNGYGGFIVTKKWTFLNASFVEFGQITNFELWCTSPSPWPSYMPIGAKLASLGNCLYYNIPIIFYEHFVYKLKINQNGPMHCCVDMV
jgi:hypothetical protein